MYGIISKYKRRNNKTGESVFIIKDATNAYITCKGITMHYSKCTPVYFDGKYVTENGESYFKIISIYASAYNKESARNFLISKLDGIGADRADKIIERFGIDIFDYVRKNICPDENSNLQRAYQLVYKYTYFEDLYDYIKKCNGDYSVAFKLHEKYGFTALEKIKSDPYRLLSVGVEYNIVEHFAKDNNIKQYNEERINGIVRTAIENSRSRGNTKIEFPDLCDSVHSIENNAKCGYFSHPLLIAENVMKNYITEESGDKLYIYRRKDFINEDIIAKNIARINLSREFFNYEPPKSIGNLSEEQSNTLNMLKTSGVKILTGGPGTGKTTTTKTIIEEYKRLHPKDELLLLAPTGCAARRLAEATEIPAYTIHSGLGATGYDLSGISTEKITADFIIVDEFTFVDTELAAVFFSRVKNKSTVLVIGDIDQLPSVEPGNVLGDMIDSGVIEYYKLTKIFRQKGDNLIHENSRKVIDGDINLQEGNNFKVYRCEDEKAVIEKVKSIASSCYKRGIENFKLYTPVRKAKFATGTIQMNELLKSIYHCIKNKKEITEIEYGDYTFSVGDKVIFTQNVKDKFYNGQEGIIKYITYSGDKEVITVETEDGDVVVTGENLEYLDLAYTITAHKSQGGECDNALIVIPKKPYSLLKRQLLYVEITRAKKNIIIISEDNALDICISSYGECKRLTGLKDKLLETVN